MRFQVVGVTTPQEVWVVSSDRPLRVSEVLVLEDEMLGNPQAQVVETRSYNRFFPLTTDQGAPDQQVLQALQLMGYDVRGEEVHLARLRLLEETPFPVRVGTRARPATFAEVRHRLVRVSPARGLVLGVIKSTEEMVPELDDDLRDLVCTVRGGEVRPQDGVPFLMDPASWQQYPHLGVFGGSGSGKSFAVRVIVEELMRLGLPAVVLDPHFEMDFSQPASGLPPGRARGFQGSFRTLLIGQDVGVDFTELGTHDLANLLGAVTPLTEPMANAVELLHKRMDSYTSFASRVADVATALEEGRVGLERRGQDPSLPATERQRYTRLVELLGEFGSLPLASVRGIQWRLRRLEYAGLFGADIRPVEQLLLSGKVAVIQGPIWLLEVFGAYLLGNLYRRRRAYRDALQRGEQAAFFPPFVVVSDEAHNFAPRGLDAPAKRLLREIAQEGRKYGVFLVLASQRPALLDETVTAQLNTKFVFRTVRASDLEVIKEETDMTADEVRRLPYLPTGDTFVSAAVLGRTVPVRIRAAWSAAPHAQDPWQELRERETQWQEKAWEAVADLLPISTVNLVHLLPKLRERLGEPLGPKEVVEWLDRLAGQGLLRKDQTPFGVTYRPADPRP
ncbi:MAG: ATP-binding protein [Bacillota bacterium]